MKIRKQVSERVISRFTKMVKAFIGVTVIMYLKNKVVEQVIESNLEDIQNQADVAEGYDWIFGEDDDPRRFETDIRILSDYGIPVVSANDDKNITTAEDDLPCQTDKYFKDEWKDWNCVRLEGANGYIEEYYEEQKCHG